MSYPKLQQTISEIRAKRVKKVNIFAIFVYAAESFPKFVPYLLFYLNSYIRKNG